MKEFFKRIDLWTFVGGAVTAVVEATVTSIKEDAQDVYAEAVEKSKAQ